MKNKILPFLIIISISLTTTSINSIAINDEYKTNLLIQNDHFIVLHIKGSYYEMGYQHGSLLSEEIIQNIRAYIDFSEKQGTSYEELLDIWNITKQYTSGEIIDEMQGMSDGANISFDLIAVTNIIPMKFHCCGVAAWNAATIDGQLIHLRSLDYPLSVVDPTTGIYLQENQVMFVREPNDGYASIYPGFAGFAGCLGGLNSQGVSFGQSSSWCDDETFYGTPMTFRLKTAIDHASSAQEATDMIITNKTLGFNYVVSDKSPIGYAVETTANHSYIGTWNNPVENTKPCWSMQDVVRRTNFFINPTTASTQRQRYNPSSFILWILQKNPDFPYWWHYKTLSEAIEVNYGKLDINTSITMLRDVYLGKTDFLMFIARIFGFPETMHQWAACPETGDIAVSFASVDTNAFENQVYYFNLFELIE